MFVDSRCNLTFQLIFFYPLLTECRKNIIIDTTLSNRTGTIQFQARRAYFNSDKETDNE